jgi:hypothetical protein
MPEPRYADVPAARHMRVPEPRSAREGTTAGTEGLLEPGPVRPPDALRPDHNEAYRRKRLVAGVLTGLVFLSVPGLIVLLVLFG